MAVSIIHQLEVQLQVKKDPNMEFLKVLQLIEFNHHNLLKNKDKDKNLY